jgi:Glyoxalase/Bleomycin resistance protein/Dioxygenase superfamily
MRRPHHISYAVSSIEQAVQHWRTVFGAGPFFLFERIKFEVVTYYGEPCTFDHSAAFGCCGQNIIELQQIHLSGPRPLAKRLIPGKLPIINHVGCISAVPERDNAELTAAGYETFMHAKAGSIELWLHDTQVGFGHAVEILRQTDFLENFFAEVSGASLGWDGNAPLRVVK